MDHKSFSESVAHLFMLRMEFFGEQTFTILVTPNPSVFDGLSFCVLFKKSACSSL
jgi:hypothetical protein